MGTFPRCSLCSRGRLLPMDDAGVPALGQTGRHTAPHLTLLLWDPASQALLSPLALLANMGQAGSNQHWFLLSCSAARPCITFFPFFLIWKGIRNIFSLFLSKLQFVAIVPHVLSIRHAYGPQEQSTAGDESLAVWNCLAC